MGQAAPRAHVPIPVSKIHSLVAGRSAGERTDPVQKIHCPVAGCSAGDFVFPSPSGEYNRPQSGLLQNVRLLIRDPEQYGADPVLKSPAPPNHTCSQ